MLTRDEIFKKLEPIFRDILDETELNLKDNLSALDIPKWDSLAHVNILVAIEIAYRIKFKTGEIEIMKNVGDLVTAIQKKQAQPFGGH